MEGHPDDEHGTKFQAIVAIGKELEQNLSVNKSKLYLWVDFHSLDQDSPAEITRGVNALPLFIQCSDVFVTLEHKEYFDRAWCMVECCFGKQCQRSRSYPLMLESQAGKIVPHSCTTDPSCAAAVEPQNVVQAQLTVEGDRSAVRFLAGQSVLLL